VRGVRFEFRGGEEGLFTYKVKTHPTPPSTPLFSSILFLFPDIWNLHFTTVIVLM